MKNIKITVTVEKEKEFTLEEIAYIMTDFGARLQGYSTVCPKFLKTADITISFDKKYNNILP
jgi:hypothetical protein